MNTPSCLKFRAAENSEHPKRLRAADSKLLKPLVSFRIRYRFSDTVNSSKSDAALVAVAYRLLSTTSSASCGRGGFGRSVTGRSPKQLLHAGEEIDRNGEDDRRVLLDTDFSERLQIPQLNAGRFGRQKMRGIHQSLRRGELAFGMNNLRAFFAFRLGLLGHRPQHGLGHIHLLDFHVGDLHAPRRGVRIADALKAQIDFVAVSQQFVEFLFAKHRAQSGLRKLRSLVGVIRDFNHGLVGIDHAQKNNRVNLQGDVVAGDDVLRRNLERFLPQRNTHHAIDRAKDQNYAWTLCRAHQASEAEDDAALVFGQDLDGAQQVNDEDDDGNRDHGKPELHIRL